MSSADNESPKRPRIEDGTTLGRTMHFHGVDYFKPRIGRALPEVPTVSSLLLQFLQFCNVFTDLSPANATVPLPPLPSASQLFSTMTEHFRSAWRELPFIKSIVEKLTSAASPEEDGTSFETSMLTSAINSATSTSVIKSAVKKCEYDIPPIIFPAPSPHTLVRNDDGDGLMHHPQSSFSHKLNEVYERVLSLVKKEVNAKVASLVLDAVMRQVAKTWATVFAKALIDPVSIYVPDEESRADIQSCITQCEASSLEELYHEAALRNESLERCLHRLSRYNLMLPENVRPPHVHLITDKTTAEQVDKLCNHSIPAWLDASTRFAIYVPCADAGFMLTMLAFAPHALNPTASPKLNAEGEQWTRAIKDASFIIVDLRPAEHRWANDIKIIYGRNASHCRISYPREVFHILRLYGFAGNFQNLKLEDLEYFIKHRPRYDTCKQFHDGLIYIQDLSMFLRWVIRVGLFTACSFAGQSECPGSFIADSEHGTLRMSVHLALALQSISTLSHEMHLQFKDTMQTQARQLLDVHDVPEFMNFTLQPVKFNRFQMCRPMMPAVLDPDDTYDAAVLSFVQWLCTHLLAADSWVDALH